MDQKLLIRLGAVGSIGVIGLTAIVFAGMSFLRTQTEPASLIAVASAAVAGLTGWLTQPNGTDMTPQQARRLRALLDLHTDLQPGPQGVDRNVLPPDPNAPAVGPTGPAVPGS